MALTLLSIIFVFIIALIVLGLYANVIDWGNPLVNIIDGWFRLFLRYYHHFEFEPVELPKQGGALLACNHISGLDPFLILGACKRPVRFMMAREEYERFGFRWLFRATGCIPVDRSSQPKVAFREALTALQQGEIIGIFPEGGIRDPNAPVKPLKRGVVVLAELANVLIYPVRISGILEVGQVIRAVIYPSRAKLEKMPSINCTRMNREECLKYLTNILRT